MTERDHKCASGEQRSIEVKGRASGGQIEVTENEWARACNLLRGTAPDSELAAWLRARNGRGLDPPQLRFWQTLLSLPDDEVNAWVAAARNAPWRGKGRES